MADDQETTESESDLPQQVDPNADLMKARPGGDSGVQGKNPGTGFRDEKTDSQYEGAGSEGGYEGGPAATYDSEEDTPPA